MMPETTFLKDHPCHLLAYATGRAEPLCDERIRQVNRKTPVWHCLSPELWTPRSLPLRISITLGAKNGLQVWSVETPLLEIGPVDAGVTVSLVLPTDETLDIRVEQRRYAARPDDH